MLDKLTEKHKIELSVIKTGHAQFTTGGSVSNHFEGRGLDIARVDGQIVNAGSTAARELASEIAELQGDLRPTEVGTPFPIGASGFFTDGDHQDHIHVAFDGAAARGLQGRRRRRAAAAAAARRPAPRGGRRGGGGPKVKPGDTQTFNIVEAEDAQGAAQGRHVHLRLAGAAGRRPRPSGRPAGRLARRPGRPAPAAVTDAAAATAAGGSPLGASALQAAQGELGVHETGYNTGVDVDKFLASAGVAPGNPWCASFVTWALEQSGHKMDGGGWAAVQTWVRNAEAGTNGLQVVSADQARPGDIVAYDWGGQEDFGSDGHIGFLASNVEGGKFTAAGGQLPGRGAEGAARRWRRREREVHPDHRRRAGAAPPRAAAAHRRPGGARPRPPRPPAAAPAARRGRRGRRAPPAPPLRPPPPGPAAAAAAARSAEATARQRASSRRGEGRDGRPSAKSRATVLFLKAIDPKAKAADRAPAPATPPPRRRGRHGRSRRAVPASSARDLGQVGDYPGDNASQAELAKWLASEAKKAGLPPELPVMASLVESASRTSTSATPTRSASSRCASGSGTRASTRASAEDPNLQAKWFIDHALAVKEQAIARGDTDFGKDPSKWGEWIADVERPAEQFRGRYQLRLDEARGLLLSC